MGQKTNSHGLRVYINKNWSSQWFSNKLKYASLLENDILIRKHIRSFTNVYQIIIGDIVIKRRPKTIDVTVDVYYDKHLKKENLVKWNEDLLKGLERITDKSCILNISPKDRYVESSTLLANYLSFQLEKRKPYKDVLKTAILECRNYSKIKGLRINCSGRLDGAEIARTEWVKDGQVPLQAIKYNISYSTSRAYTIYGVCGFKVWICYK